MAIETREKEINGAIYTVTQLPARRAIRLKAKLIRMFGPVVAQMFLTADDPKRSGKKTAEQERQQINDQIKAVELLASNLDEMAFENLIVEILAGCRKSGMELVPSIIDLEFAGDMATLYQVIWFVLEVNYANFFSLLVDTGSQSQAQEMSQNVVTKKTFTRN